MACFIVPVAEAVITTAASKLTSKKENRETDSLVCKFTDRLGWLNGMLWGGSALLAFEHVWHGEVTPFFPFLTAMSDPADTAEMLHEMSTVGVGMAALVTCVWVGMVLAADFITKRAVQRGLPAAEGAGK